MNAIQEPSWAEKFQEYLVNKLDIGDTDAACIVGELHSFMRKYKNSIDDVQIVNEAIDSITSINQRLDNAITADQQYWYQLGYIDGYHETIKKIMQ